jgi:ClpP class serine protease
MINLALSKEIYGMNAWCVDQSSLTGLLSILDNIKNGVSLEIPDVKYNSISFLDFSSNETRLVKSRWDLSTGDQFNGIGIISLNGVITVSGGASSYGMDYLSEQMQLMAKDDRVKSFIILGDSGGGSSNAVEIMAETIKEVNQTKPVYGLVKKGGMMASACFGIMSACRNIWAESEMSIVGSAGTMMQFEGRKANDGTEDDAKTKHIRVYAPESTKKNKGFEDAIQRDDYTFIVDSLLQPMNQRFLSLIEANRPQLSGTSFRDGHTVFAKDAIGTFIDGIKSFSEVLEIASASASENSNNLNTNINTLNMTKAEIKSAHPTAYNEIVAEGTALENDRVGAWMAHVETDPKAVAQGIASGKEITATQREAFFVMQNTKKTVQSMQSENADDVQSPESKTPEKLATEALEKESKAAFDFELK